jgi:hypothetical protein
VAQFALIVAATDAVFGLLGPAVAHDQMNGALDWGFIASSFGIGTLAGGLAGMKIRPKYPMPFATCCVFFFCGLQRTLSVPLSV